MKEGSVIPVEKITGKIYFIRKEKIILDSDLAELYGVETRVLKQAVKRNLDRFPEDFMFKLTESEWSELITICDNLGNRKFSPTTPFAFTEQGVAMLSSVLNSKRAIQVNIAIMRAFVRLRQVLAAHKELANRLAELENRMDKQDQEIMAVFEAIRELMAPPPQPPKFPMGFHP